MIFTVSFILNKLKISLPLQLLQNTWKNHVADVRHKAFDSTPGDISTRSDYAERFGFDPDGQIQMNSLKTIVPYPWKVAV